MHCSECAAKQSVQDKKREGRERNYMKEHLNNLENHYRNYVVSSFRPAGILNGQLDIINF